MGLKTVPAYIGQTGYLHPVELDRNLIEGIFARTGALRVGDFAVTPTATSGQVSIAPGRAALVGTENAQQGAYWAWSDAADLQVFAAASGNPRIDSLLLRVKDDQYGTISGSPAAYWDIVQGVASGSPTARTDSEFNSGGGFYIPGAWWRVADIRRNLGDTTIPGGQITSNLRYTRGARAMFLAPNATARAAITDASIGDELCQTDTMWMFVWNGSSWQLQAQSIWGKNQVPGSEATLLASMGGAANLYSGPAVPIVINEAYEVTYKVFAVSFSGNNYEFGVDFYNNTTMVDSSGAVPIVTSGNWGNACGSFTFKAGGSDTTFTPVLKGYKISGAGNGDIRCSLAHPFTINIKALGKLSSAIV